MSVSAVTCRYFLESNTLCSHEFIPQAFDGEELLKCLKKLVQVDQDWVPQSMSNSLYIRPTMIGTEVGGLAWQPIRSTMISISITASQVYYDQYIGKLISIRFSQAYIDLRYRGTYRSTSITASQANYDQYRGTFSWIGV